MHTNLNLDEKLVAEALRLTGLRTKKAVVEEALRALIRLNKQQEVRRLRGMMQWPDPEPDPEPKRGAPPAKTARKGKSGAGSR